MNTFLLAVSTPDGDVFREEVCCISVRGVEGDLAVMAGHIPFVTYVKEGICHITDSDGKVTTAQTAGGLITVGKDVTRFLPTAFTFENE